MARTGLRGLHEEELHAGGCRLPTGPGGQGLCPSGGPCGRGGERRPGQGREAACPRHADPFRIHALRPLHAHQAADCGRGEDSILPRPGLRHAGRLPRRLRPRHQGRSTRGRVLRPDRQGDDRRSKTPIEGQGQGGVGRVHGQLRLEAERCDPGHAQRAVGQQDHDRLMERPLGHAPVPRHERAGEGHLVSDGHGRLRPRPSGMALQQGQPACSGHPVHADTQTTDVIRARHPFPRQRWPSVEWLRPLQPQADRQGSDDIPGVSEFHTAWRGQIDSRRTAWVGQGAGEI